MSLKEAEKIINGYGAAIANRVGMAGRKSDLPCSLGKIKQAYFVYLDALISEGLLTQELGGNLVTCYSMMKIFVDDEEAEEINAIKTEGMEKASWEKKKQYVDFARERMRDGELFDEINEFIAECYKKYGT